MALAANTPALDFETLLSRGYRPANVTKLIPRDKYQPNKDVKKKKQQQHVNDEENHNNTDDDEYQDIAMRRMQMEEISHTYEFISCPFTGRNSNATNRRRIIQIRSNIRRF
jgi:hypothetical protein